MKQRTLFVLAASLLCGAWLGAGAAVAAEPPPLLWGKEPPICPTGAGAGQCMFPRGVAADPETGHVFVGDQDNGRIEEFTARGGFVKSWGWDVVVGDGTGLEVCSGADGDICKSGIGGSGVGQLGAPQGVAVDSAGNIYVVDITNFRVQKFDAQGNFVLMFGGGVDQGGGSPSNPGNLCTAEYLANGDTCGQGSEGSGAGEFGGWSPPGQGFTVGSFIAITADDKVYVGDNGRIQRFDTGGHFVESLAIPGEAVQSLAVDTTGNLYAIYRSKPGVRKLTPAGVELAKPRFEDETPSGMDKFFSAVAVDALGNVYAFGPTRDTIAQADIDPIVEFDSAGNRIAAFGKNEFISSTGLGTNLCPGNQSPGDLYVTNLGNSPSPPAQPREAAFVRAYGTPPDNCGKAITEPASEIEETAATLNGKANPKGEAIEECLFEYGVTPSYEESVPCLETPGSLGEGTNPGSVHVAISGLQKATTYHFRLVVKAAAGTEVGGDETFKTLGPPGISEDHVVAVTQTDASLKAIVNPEGFATAYHFEYGLTDEYGQGTSPVGVGSDRDGHAAAAMISGLLPGHTYHWRIVAVNSSGTTMGEDHTLNTYRASVAELPCSNDALRIDASALLPDCRAYEMVSPIEKNGGDIYMNLGTDQTPGGYVQSTPEGDGIAYASVASFGDEPSGFSINQYLARRGSSSGWSTHGLQQPYPGDPVDASGIGLSREFGAFSSDLCTAWLVDNQMPPLAPAGQAGYRNLYQRDNCAPRAAYDPPTYAAYEPLIPTPPTLKPGTEPFYVKADSIQGISADEHHVLFVAKTSLPHVSDPEAADDNAVTQLYDRSNGVLRLVSVLPIGVASPNGGELGSGSSFNLDHALSSDGSLAYWTGGLINTGTGRLFVRRNPSAAQSALQGGSATGTGTYLQGTNTVSELTKSSGEYVIGQTITGDGIPYGTKIVAKGATSLTISKAAIKSAADASLEAFGACVESDKGCTVPVSITNSAVFWTATEDGSKALYSEDEDLYEFDLARAEEGQGPRLVASHVTGVAGASDDLARIYFASTDELATGAQAGEPNLYLAEGEESLSFVATLLDGDVGLADPGASFPAYNVISPRSFERATRVNPSGARLVFQSRAQLTDYANIDANVGKRDVEVYSYGVGSGLVCLSCNPGQARPLGAEMGQPYIHPVISPVTNVSAAAWIPTWEHAIRASNVLSDDGGRVFFNATDALVPRDNNRAQDVYEWEAPGTGSCTTSSDSYFADNGGCLYLISSAEDSHESEFLEADPDGSDVFFNTKSSLLPQDPGSIDLYDARIGGGFPQKENKAPCEGEACQSPPPPPDFGTPSSATHEGPGNVGQKAKKRRCGKGKRRVHRNGKVRCVKHRKHRANRKGRANR